MSLVALVAGGSPRGLIIGLVRVIHESHLEFVGFLRALGVLRDLRGSRVGENYKSPSQIVAVTGYMRPRARCGRKRQAEFESDGTTEVTKVAKATKFKKRIVLTLQEKIRDVHATCRLPGCHATP